MATTKRRGEAIWIEKKKYWEIKVQKDGVRESFRSSTPGRRGKHDAEGKADDWLENQHAEEVRLEAAWALFLAYHKAHNGTSNYNGHEMNGRLYILPSVGNRKLSQITPIMWQKCIDAAAAKGLSRRSCLNVKLSISAFITYGRRNRWNVGRLERGDVVIPKSAPVGQKSILQPKDLKKLFSISTVTKFHQEIPAHFIYAWRFIVLTGIREGELCGIRNEDIEDNILHIRRSINSYGEETKGKNDNARRYMGLSENALAVLADQRTMLRAKGIISPWAFPDEFGERAGPRHMYSMWLTYRKQHDIGVTVHEMRHTFISIVKNDMPMSLLKAQVGHSEDMDTLGIYGHGVEGEMLQAAKYVDTAFNRIMRKPRKVGGKVGGKDKKSP